MSTTTSQDGEHRLSSPEATSSSPLSSPLGSKQSTPESPASELAEIKAKLEIESDSEFEAEVKRKRETKRQSIEQSEAKDELKLLPHKSEQDRTINHSLRDSRPEEAAWDFSGLDNISQHKVTSPGGSEIIAEVDAEAKEKKETQPKSSEQLRAEDEGEQLPQNSHRFKVQPNVKTNTSNTSDVEISMDVFRMLNRDAAPPLLPPPLAATAVSVLAQAAAAVGVSESLRTAPNLETEIPTDEMRDVVEIQEPEPEVPTLIMLALEAIRKTPVDGEDTLVVLFPYNLSKTLLCRSARLSDQSALLRKLFSELDVYEDAPEHQGIRLLLVLDERREGEVPQLSKRSTTYILPPKQEPTLSAPNGTDDSTIKSEHASDQQPVATVSQRQTTTHQAWCSAYHRVFFILKNHNTPMPSFDPITQFFQIESTIKAAVELQAFPAVKHAFRDLFDTYINSRAIYKAISERPVNWLYIGLTAQHVLIYDEAFKHVVGSLPKSPRESLVANLPKEARDTIVTKADDLYASRKHVDNQLLLLTFTVHSASAGTFVPASCTDDPQAWTVVNIFLDWVRDHIGYLDDMVVGKVRDSPPFGSCVHTGSCLTAAGFYGILYKGGDQYLPTDEVAQKFEKLFTAQKSHSSDHQITKQTLTKLKNKASAIVKPLVQSELIDGIGEKVDYLTCITVESKDLPFEDEKKVEKTEDIEMMDMD